MSGHLVLTVRFHGDGQGSARFHGVGQGSSEWPPAPARLFQALVAGAARGNLLPDSAVSALQWLESLHPPLIGAPTRRLGQSINLFVPNNDADALADPRDVSSLRVGKFVQPSLFAEDVPLLYAWESSGAADHARAIVEAADGVYQLGRGVDMAWATAELLDDDAFETRLQGYPGIVHRPERSGRGSVLACPTPGSLASLLLRHRTEKLREKGSGRKARVLFSNPPKPRFVSVSYERACNRFVFELRARDSGELWSWALGRAVKLIETVRDQAAARLRAALPEAAQDIESTLVGRKTESRGAPEPADRMRIVPLPSIGFIHADQAIRRLCLEVPSGTALAVADVEWAFSGLEWHHPVTGEMAPLRIVKSDDDDMLQRYCSRSSRWRSVTAVALPHEAKRRRIEPTRQREEAKGSAERIAEEDRAVAAVHIALRHCGIRATAVAVRVQREPFERKGARAEVFAEGTRFAKERLWHVEIEFDRPVEGPVVIGDGRFVGLGVMAPILTRWIDSQERSFQRRSVAVPRTVRGVFAFSTRGLESPSGKDQVSALSRALRRAVMARVQHELGREPLGWYFTGHEQDRDKAASEDTHLAFQWDPRWRRFLVIAPHCLERREASWDEKRKLDGLERALEEFVELRAGVAGRFALSRVSIAPNDPLIQSSRRWISLTPYLVTRHQKCAAVSDAVVRDVLVECERRRLPRPHVKVLEVRGVSGRGLEGRVQLDFAVAIEGPILLGRTRYLGGGMFIVGGTN